MYKDEDFEKTNEMIDDMQKQIKNKETKKLSEIIIKYFCDMEGVEFFHNQENDTFISILENNIRKTYRCNSSDFKEYIASISWRMFKKGIQENDIREIVSVFNAKAKFDGRQYETTNRIAFINNEILYDLIRQDSKIIVINKNGWDLVAPPPILFEKFKHQLEQVLPSKEGDPFLLLKYINISNEKEKNLFLIYVISCFINNIPHPVLMVYGQQGSAKSTLFRILKEIIDPSSIKNELSIPNKDQELIQQLSKNYFLAYGNVTKISQDQSDLFCQASTGGSGSKRKLYTDNEDIIINFKCCVAVNGINLEITKPDLLQRGLIFELHKIERRRSENDLNKEFKKDLPIIFGGICNTLVNVLKIKDSIKFDNDFRMADFAIYGCAIAISLGLKQEDFIEYYKQNIEKQNESILEDSFVFEFIKDFIKQRDEWIGTMGELLKTMNLNRDKYENVNIPKYPNILSREINILKDNLEKIGIFIESRKCEKRVYKIFKKTSSLSSVKNVVNSSKNDGDDNNVDFSDLR